ncbi:MAG: hypothetical protein Unbinned5858contig1004_18 [Prokaryotic dsDNA virus sp.]|nr:MAG: hypothetical protein Unbinned5858contig1004_18 [Prokaryotic dsDNA virus sp.]|tara:strand:- start:13494 stop:15860 length:2367 start_codon:yes stop_codon:yes gene_type:complete
MLNLFLKRELVAGSGNTIFDLVSGYANESMPYALRFSDLENIQSPVGSFSQTFTIPKTDNTQTAFGQIEHPGYHPANDDQTKQQTLFFKQKYPAALGALVPEIFGYVQIKNIIQVEDRTDYEVVFFADAVDLTKAIGDKQLSDLNISSYNHDLNTTNFASAAFGSLFSGDVRYGLIDKGSNYSIPDRPPWTEDDGIYMGEFTPYIRAKALIDKIFADAGLTYTSDFFETADFANIYMPAYNGAPTPFSDDQGDNRCAAGLAADYGATSGIQRAPIVDSINGGLDPGNKFNNTTNAYTAPYTCRVDVRVNAHYRKVVSANSHVFVYLYKNGSLFHTIVDGGISSSNTDSRFETVEFDAAYNGFNNTSGPKRPEIFLEDGDTLELRYEISNGTNRLFGTNPYTSATPGVGEAYTTSLEVYNVSEPLSGQDVDMAANMPEMKQIDFLTSLQKMFNLVFIPSGIDKDFIIEPWDDYFASGDEYDWSNKVLTDKTRKMRPTTDLQFKDYEWTFREGLDFISDAVELSLDRVYGAFQVTDPENDFATGEKKVETALGNYILSLIPGTSIAIHRSLTSDGGRIENPLPMLAYWGGIIDSFGNWYLRQDDGTTGSPSTVFPFFSPYSANRPTLTDNDLNFGMESAFVPQECNPLNTLYYKYWRDYVRELYSESSRILECEIVFDKVDLIRWKWNNKYFYNGAYWRALELDVDLSNMSFAKVKLIKITESTRDCEDLPTSFDSNLQAVLFNGSTSLEPDYGSRECCIRYGYTWLPSKAATSKCIPRTQQTTPSNETT